jgi:hypothetical protein
MLPRKPRIICIGLEWRDRVFMPYNNRQLLYVGLRFVRAGFNGKPEAV